jgi:hypothetical protein
MLNRHFSKLTDFMSGVDDASLQVRIDMAFVGLHPTAQTWVQATVHSKGSQRSTAMLGNREWT